MPAKNFHLHANIHVLFVLSTPSGEKQSIEVVRSRGQKATLCLAIADICPHESQGLAYDAKLWQHKTFMSVQT